MSATVTIAKQRKLIEDLRTDIKKYRDENPQIAAVYTENELLKKYLVEAEERLEYLTKTVGGALEHALANPVSARLGGIEVSDTGVKSVPAGGYDVANLFLEKVKGNRKAEAEQEARYEAIRAQKEADGRDPSGLLRKAAALREARNRKDS